MNNVLAQGQQQQMANNSMYNELNNKMAARALQLGMQRSQQLKGEWAQGKQTANQNLMSGLGGILSGLVPKPTGMPMGGEEAEMMSPSMPAGLTGGDSANAPDLGGGGAFPELMGSAAFLNNLGAK